MRRQLVPFSQQDQGYAQGVRFALGLNRSGSSFQTLRQILATKKAVPSLSGPPFQLDSDVLMAK